MGCIWCFMLVVNLVKSLLAHGFVSSSCLYVLSTNKKDTQLSIFFTNTPSLKRLDHRQRSQTKFTGDSVCVNIDNSVTSTAQVKVFPWEGLFLHAIQCRQGESKNEDDILEHLCQVTFARFDHNDLQ